MANALLRDIPAGSNVLLDANVLIYSLSGISADCVELMRRCILEEISGFTTVEIVNEVSHRLMIAEAFSKGLITKPNSGALKGKHEVIRGLNEYWIQAERVLESNHLVLDLNELRIRHAQDIRRSHGLLTTDATILAAAFELGIDRIATNDTDFQNITGIMSHHPGDVP
jgi:predicted nucleic acid-binding protein